MFGVLRVFSDVWQQVDRHNWIYLRIFELGLRKTERFNTLREDFRFSLTRSMSDESIDAASDMTKNSATTSRFEPAYGNTG